MYKYEGGPELAETLLAEKPNDLHCYSEDTEILTLTGWKTFGELTLEDRVAQFVQETKETVFVQPLEIVWQPYKGPMVHFNNRSTDMLLTPNHRVLYRSQNSKEYSIKRADEVSQFTSQLMYPTSSKWCGRVSEYTKEFYELLIATQADGHLCKDSNAIQFSFVKQRKVDRLSDILKTLNVQHSVRTCERKGRIETTIRLKAKDLTTLTLRKYFSENKKILLNMIELPYSIRYHILDCIKYWDGTIRKNGDIVIDTTDESFVDVLQSICAVTNAKCVKNSYNKKIKGSYCRVYRLYYSLDKNVAEKSIMNCSNLVDYDGMIGCVSVPSGLITVRRNGKVFVSGNTINSKKLGISRDNAKALTYALLYGAAPQKLKKMLNLDDEGAEKMYNAFWDSVPPLKEFRDNATKFWEGTGKEYVVGIDKRKFRVRSAHSIVNLLFQSAGSLAVKYTTMLVAQQLESQGLLGDLTKDTLEESQNKVNQCIVYHKSKIC